MKAYKKIYSFNVLDELKEGKTVFILDRETNLVQNANEMYLADYVNAMNNTGNENRFDFWTVEEVEETENE